MTTKIDARGKACPQPVMMTKQAVDNGAKDVTVFLDNPVAASNVQRFLSKQGFSVSLRDDNGDLIVEAQLTGNLSQDPQKKAASAQAKSCPEEKNAIFISHNVMGGDDKELGEVLIKGFLGTLAQLDVPPAYIALMNEGVKLALKGTPTCEHLQDIASKGTTILVCGTCSNHFGITEKIGVGTISNMFEITDTLLKASKVISM
ncbi:sulfurtransferase-like selenium metabolism protein YedF [Aminobacterium sp. MB27-C1]|jgi:selenium metabolism protein YedF|uniref:sulfurtransferase-like selenium metabolism protein YedF n=1 Tax=unclassified Aminobacterium TaxID=2685012 RepID=UPI001BCD3253|nr:MULTISPECIES: sulfurtransferase-like selenium metabolism protein YedF [unclassified Aminobacterium]MDD2205775.1 sulfurtransferase-like selenium metabolism protein YedF [Aminobacterium sp.]MDD3708196.1 sulfurtransferase-like selenium metabolism protein YedF [Aminobacterium sp.]MDD4229262.1 sulfurtransferase-like selenium metabolism protein YedF [Aminobacterium sp.]MDD4550955.1 sulfurtransferase-like selenium metabolism protein YedF [Aminobacterium sp.]MEA4876772.1 sulfurtransferase-like sele